MRIIGKTTPRQQAAENVDLQVKMQDAGHEATARFEPIVMKYIVRTQQAERKEVHDQEDPDAKTRRKVDEDTRGPPCKVQVGPSQQQKMSKKRARWTRVHLAQALTGSREMR